MSIILHAGFPLHFWVEVVDIFVWLVNIEPSSSLDGGILEKAWTSEKGKLLIPRDFQL